MILCYLCNNVVFEGDRAELLGMSAHQSCVDDFAFHFPEADLAKMSDAAVELTKAYSEIRAERELTANARTERDEARKQVCEWRARALPLPEVPR